MCNFVLKNNVHVHDSRIYVLNVCYPAISADTKITSSAPIALQWNNIFLAVRLDKPGSDTVKLDTHSTDNSLSKYKKAPIVNWDTNIN